MAIFLSFLSWLSRTFPVVVLAGALVVTGCWCQGRAHAEATQQPPLWRTGAALTKRLGEPVGVHWSSSPLRETLYHLGRKHGVAVLVDRRVDPGQPLDLDLDGVPLGQVFAQVAQQRQLGVTLMGDVIYLGPTEVAAWLRTLAELRREELARLPPDQARPFFRTARMAWDDLDSPRSILSSLAKGAGLEIVSLEAVPHDLWAAADLPPLSLYERLTLVLVQFDLTFQVGGGSHRITLLPVPAEVAVVRSYPGGAQPEQTAARFAALVPDCHIKVVGGKVFVRGRLEDHERLTGVRSPLGAAPAQPAQPGLKQQRFTGTIRGPLSHVLERLAAQLRLNIQFDFEGLQKANISLDQEVNFTAHQATLDELLSGVLKPAGCTFQRRGEAIVVLPAPGA